MDCYCRKRLDVTFADKLGFMSVPIDSSLPSLAVSTLSIDEVERLLRLKFTTNNDELKSQLPVLMTEPHGQSLALSQACNALDVLCDRSGIGKKGIHVYCISELIKIVDNKELSVTS
ncbi:hypothetical protein N7490_007120 [Penicillium lividum]|nr:hypothetical protein N7490_007120 [Penicillium lividum]